MVHCLNHAFEHRVDELLSLLWIAVGNQLRRTRDISEQNGDLLSLALEGCLGSENPVGEMPRCVILGGGKAGFTRNKFQGMSAFGAELGCGRDLAPTDSLVSDMPRTPHRTWLWRGFRAGTSDTSSPASAGHRLDAKGKKRSYQCC